MRNPSANVFPSFPQAPKCMNAVLSLLLLLICWVMVSPANAGTFDGAMTRTKYVVLTGDVNGDGQNDVLMKAMPTLVMIPVDDDLQVPIQVAPPSPTFALISAGYGSYTLVVGPDVGTVGSPVWLPGTQKLTFSGANGAVADSASIAAVSNEQASFTIVMSGVTGQLQIASSTPPVVNASAQPSSSTPIAVAVTPPHLGNADAGTLPGELTADASGSSVYLIPLALPPGSGNMTPSLALKYASNGGNGAFGLGWSLEGLSSIHRCAKTIAQDGVPGRISFDNADRLCLDGNRLVRVNGPARPTNSDEADNEYWANLTEYRTESESFKRITRLPDGSFKVELKDGRVSYYGRYRGNPSSSIFAQGRTDGKPLLWALGGTEDRVGNFIAFEYTQNSSIGEYNLSAVRYGGNFLAGKPADLAVQFVYEGRGDAQVQFIGGSHNDIRARLTHIKTLIDTAADGSGGTIVRDHQVKYVESASSGRSLVDSMQVCALNPINSLFECLPKTTFSWGTRGPLSLKTLQGKNVLLPVLDKSVTGPNATYLQPSRYQADLDGSGRTSFIVKRLLVCDVRDCFNVPNVPNVLRIQLPNGVEFDREIDVVALGFPPLNPIDIRIGDLNGDGRDDLILVPGRHGHKWAYCINSAALDGTVNFDCRPAVDGFVQGVVDLRGEKKAHVIAFRNQITFDLVDCEFTDGQMSCSPLGLTSVPSATAVAMPLPKGGDGFGLSGINLSRKDNSDFLVTWFNKIPAADPAHGHKIYDDSTYTTYKVYDFSIGTGTCMYRAKSLSCEAVYNRIMAGDSVYGLTASSNDPFTFYTAYNAPTMITGRTIGDLNGDGLADFAYGWSETSKIRDDMPETYTQVRAANLCLSKENGSECQPSGVLQAGLLDSPMPAPNASSVFGLVGDFLGDGVARIILADGLQRMKLCRLTLSGLVCEPFSLGIAANVPQVVSLDDSGVAAFLSGCNNQQSVQDRTPCVPVSLAVPAGTDKLVSVTNGVGHTQEIDYARGDDTAVYRRFGIIGGVERKPIYPQVAVSPGVMVKQIRRKTGQNSALTTDYFYEGAMVDALGRGSLGFSTYRVTIRGEKSESDVVHLSTLAQVYPFVGKVLTTRVTSRNGAVVLQDTSSVHEQQNFPFANGSRTTFAYTGKITETRNDLDGSPFGSTVKELEFLDGWGNLTRETATEAGPGLAYTATTMTDYRNDISSWQIGRPTFVTAIKRASGSEDIIRQTKYEFNVVNGLLDRVTVEPGNAKYEVVTNYDRSGNAFGLVNREVQTWRDPDPSVPSTATRTVSDTTYDSKGRFPERVKNALGHQQVLEFYAATGAKKSLRGPNSEVTTWKTDGFGRVVTEVRPDNTESRRAFKQCDGLCPQFATTAEIVEVFSGNSRMSTPVITYYDNVGNIVRDLKWGFDGRQIFSDRRYDARGMLFESDNPRFDGEPAFLERRQLYDELGRLIQVHTLDEQGVQRTSSSKYSGFVITHTNAAGQKQVETSDVQRHIRKVENVVSDGVNAPVSVVTTIAYDASGNLTSVIDPNGNVTKIAYDILGRKIELADPDLGRIEYQIDPPGRVWKQISPKQRASLQFSRMRYDVLDRLTARFETDLESHWEFDTSTYGIGKISEAYTLTGGVKDYRRIYTYDNIGRPRTKTQQIYTSTFLSKFDYDAWGRLLTQTMQVGSNSPKIFDNRYNKFGYLERVERGGLVLAKTQSLDADFRVAESVLGNGLTISRNYNRYTRRLDASAAVAGGSLLRVQEGYQYDALGNVLMRTQYWDQNGFIEKFKYDELNRLRSSKVGDFTEQAFNYDLAGNITFKTGIGAFTYSLQGINAKQPHAVQSINGLGTFVYDDNGNMLSGAGRTASWTSFDMPQSLTKGGVKSTFVYGSEQQRTRQIFNDGAYVVYAGEQEIEVASNGAVTLKTYWPNGLGVEIDRPSAPSEFNWTHVDRLGSPIALSDRNGLLREKLAYDAWGKRRTLDGSASPDTLDGKVDNRGFTGHEMLDRLDLVHMNGRVYDPLTAKFLSADPYVKDIYNGQNYNRYAYVLNNPTNLTDPTGYEWTEYIPVYGNIAPYRESISEGRFGHAALFGGMAIFDGATLGLGSILDAPLKTALKNAVKNELKEALAKEAAEQAAAATARAAEQAAAKSAEKAAAERATQEVATNGANGAASAAERAAPAGKKRGPKTDKDAPHNKKVRESAEQFVADNPGSKIVAGGGVLPERLVKTTGGAKAGRRPDTIIELADKTEVALQVGKAKADGSMIKREAEAYKDLTEKANLPTTFIPYNR